MFGRIVQAPDYRHRATGFGLNQLDFVTPGVPVAAGFTRCTFTSGSPHTLKIWLERPHHLRLARQSSSSPCDTSRFRTHGWKLLPNLTPYGRGDVDHLYLAAHALVVPERVHDDQRVAVSSGRFSRGLGVRRRPLVHGRDDSHRASKWICSFVVRRFHPA
jgi:hypothetical protein